MKPSESLVKNLLEDEQDIDPKQFIAQHGINPRKRFLVQYCGGTEDTAQTLPSAFSNVAYAFKSTIQSIHDLQPVESSGDNLVSKLIVSSAGNAIECRLEPDSPVVATITEIF